MATATLRASKLRSLLTMLGIIIGVASVVTIVSIGEGIRRQITAQTSQSGPELITVRPGQPVQRNDEGAISGFSPFFSLTSGTLTEQDTEAIQAIPGVARFTPMNSVAGTLETNNRSFSQAVIIGAFADTAEILNQELAFGTFFAESDSSMAGAVIGRTVAEGLFNESGPIGKTFQLRGQAFVVRGVFDSFPESAIALSVNYNTAVFIPYDKSKELAAGQTNIFQILVRAANESEVEPVAGRIENALLANRDGQDNFTVIKQDENIEIIDTITFGLTAVITAVAAISLFVGGIGVMNIMLVSVTQRTSEIGIRKAIGASNQQILGQFFAEGAMLSVVGGALGVLAALLANYLLRVLTDLRPVITFDIVMIAALVSVVIGILFSIAPAFQAARKDPIVALKR